MKIEFDIRELEFSWFKLRHLKVPNIARDIQSIVFEVSEYIDKSPKQKRNEDVRNWLKRIPNKYSVRYAKYLYYQAKSLYLEIKTREIMYNYKKLDVKTQKELKKVLDKVTRVFSQAEEQYEEVLIRRRAKI